MVGSVMRLPLELSSKPLPANKDVKLYATKTNAEQLRFQNENQV